MLKGQLATLTEQKHSELLVLCESRLQASVHVLYDRVLTDARASFGACSSRHGAEQAFGNGAPREGIPFDTSDYKILELASDPSLAVFKEWKHDLELFIETIGSSWKDVPSILRTSRFLNTEFAEKAVTEMRGLKTKHEPSAPDLEFGFDFLGKADALYKLIMPRLPTALGTELRQVGVTNGFELFCKLIPKLDPPRADSALHLANEIRGLGGISVCKDFLDSQSASQRAVA